jgi:hypothetical protein
LHMSSTVYLCPLNSCNIAIVLTTCVTKAKLRLLSC